MYSKENKHFGEKLWGKEINLIFMFIIHIVKKKYTHTMSHKKRLQEQQEKARKIE